MIRVYFALTIIALPCMIGAVPLSLEDSIKIAITNNRTLQGASLGIISTKAKVAEAKAGCLPALKASSSYTRLDSTPSMMGIILGDENIYDIKTTLQQPIFTGGKITSAIGMADASLKAAGYNYQRCKNEVILQIKEGYFGVLTAEKFYKVAYEGLKQVEAHLLIVKNFYDAGMATKVDILKAEVQLATVRQGLIKAEHRVCLAKAGFNSILGQDLNTQVELEDILQAEHQNIDLVEIEYEAMTNRPELMSLKESLIIADLNIALARSDCYPNIAFFANYDYKKGESLPIEWEGSWAAGITANINLWDWGSTKARVSQAKVNLKQIQNNLIQLKDGIALEIREVYLSIKEAQEAIGVAEKQVAQAEEAFRMQENMHKEGAATSTDVLDAQTLLTQAKTNYYQALYDYNLALAKLNKTTGR